MRHGSGCDGLQRLCSAGSRIGQAQRPFAPCVPRHCYEQAHSFAGLRSVVLIVARLAASASSNSSSVRRASARIRAATRLLNPSPASVAHVSAREPSLRGRPPRLRRPVESIATAFPSETRFRPFPVIVIDCCIGRGIEPSAPVSIGRPAKPCKDAGNSTLFGGSDFGSDDIKGLEGDL